MAENHLKTDLEVRFDMFKKQYHDRQAEARRTGKPIPAHTQRWYDRQIEEYRVSLKRLGLIMTLAMPTVAEAIDRITAVKEEIDFKATVSPQGRREKRKEAVKEYNAKWRQRMSVEEKEKRLQARREYTNNARLQERMKRAAARQEQLAAGLQIEVHIPARAVVSPDIMSMRVEKKRAKERRRGAKKKAKINACPELREAYLQKERCRCAKKKAKINACPELREAYQQRERERAKRKREERRDPSLITARILAAEAVIAEALESGELDAKERKLCAHSIRTAQSHLSQEERERMNQRRGEQRRQKKRIGERVAMLRAQAVEPGWAQRAIEEDAGLRVLYEAYLNRSVNSTVWYKLKHGIPHTQQDVAIIRADRSFLLLLQLDANHNFLHRIDELRKESLRQSGLKQRLIIRNTPHLHAEHNRKCRERYQQKVGLRTGEALQEIAEETSSTAQLENWIAVYEQARKRA